MQSKILLLDETTANQIAAGEVIDRPASIVKELVENSLDAGADKVAIFLEEGGLTSVKVVDNGLGMNREDLKLAFQRHSTSKIKKINDLEDLRTMGFRGEALASISSVACIELATRMKEDVIGTKLTLIGGTVSSMEDIGCPIGTSMIVKDLFFNTPARKKYLKNHQRELAVINELVHKLALANPAVGFSLHNNGKRLLNFPAGFDLKRRIVDVFGVETAKEMIYVSKKTDLFELEGFIGKPAISKLNRGQQSIFINSRYIKSKLISQAVEKGYHTYLMIHRYPIFILHLSLDPSMVDVNVHPTKMEVKLDHETELFSFIADSVKDVLRSNFFKAEPSPKLVIKNNYEQVKLDSIIDEPLALKEPDISSTDYDFSASDYPFLDNTVPTQKLPYMNPIGQIEATYIACQGTEGLYLIDQHAAHERILYEELMAKDKLKEPMQQMVIPVTFELKSGYAQLLIENVILFTKLGFIIEHFGGDTFIIRGVPIVLSDVNIKVIIMDLLDSIKEHGLHADKIQLTEKLLIKVACKGAIKAKERLEPKEMVKLIESLGQTDNPYTCPHGRPTFIHFSGYELEKKFKRIV